MHVRCAQVTGITVVRLADERLQTGTRQLALGCWALCLSRLSTSLNTGQEDVSREKAERLLNSIQEALAGEAPREWDHYYLAVGNRILGRREEAYRQLDAVFPVF